MRRIGALFGVLVLTTTACGNSGGSKGAQPAKPTTTTTKPTKVQTIVAAGLLRGSDLPGYSQRPPGTNSSDFDQLAKGVPGCEAFVSALVHGSHRQKSPRFTRGGVHVDDSVDFYGSAADIAGQVDLFRDPATLPCLRDALRKGLTEQLGTTATIDALDVSPIAVNEVGDGQFALRFTITIDQNGQKSTILMDLVGVAVGRFALSFISQGTTEQVAELETTLIPKVVDRMKQAGA
jgi:hypothetical protein